MKLPDEAIAQAANDATGDAEDGANKSPNHPRKQNHRGAHSQKRQDPLFGFNFFELKKGHATKEETTASIAKRLGVPVGSLHLDFIQQINMHILIFSYI